MVTVIFKSPQAPEDPFVYNVDTENTSEALRMAKEEQKKAQEFLDEPDWDDDSNYTVTDLTFDVLKRVCESGLEPAILRDGKIIVF